jgi:hypothetical protein
MLSRMHITLLVVVALAIGIALLEKMSEYLIIDQTVHTDVIVVLAVDRNDRRFSRGIELLHQGYAPQMLVDANSDMILLWDEPLRFSRTN